jgi:hypothetical protein
VWTNYRHGLVKPTTMLKKVDQQVLSGNGSKAVSMIFPLTLSATAIFIYFILLPKVTCGLKLQYRSSATLDREKTALLLCQPIGALPPSKAVI